MENEQGSSIGPIAYASDLNFDRNTAVIHECDRNTPWKKQKFDIPLYTTPCIWRGLSEEEKYRLRKLGFVGVEKIESMLKERNT